MFVSVLDVFKVGIGPSSSHTSGPMLAAGAFRTLVQDFLKEKKLECEYSLTCALQGSLAYTGHGHATDKAVLLGLHGYSPSQVFDLDLGEVVADLWTKNQLSISSDCIVKFDVENDLEFQREGEPPEHPNSMIFELFSDSGDLLLSQTYFSVGGGFILTREEWSQGEDTGATEERESYPYNFNSGESMLSMAAESGLTVAEMKEANEVSASTPAQLDASLDFIWKVMRRCTESGLSTEGVLPGGLNVNRRAKNLHEQLLEQAEGNPRSDWLCAYAMAVNEENAAGNMVVTAPTNGAAGVIPAVLYFLVKHGDAGEEDIRTFLLTAAAICSIIKFRASISGAEMGCQGEVGSASSMAAAGLCAVMGGTPEQVEHAAEMALEHHLGMTCDPVKGLVQVPCIERNGFGAVKAYTAASLSMRGTGYHFMSLDHCIAAMKETGLAMSAKFKETSLGGLAVNYPEC